MNWSSDRSLTTTSTTLPAPSGGGSGAEIISAFQGTYPSTTTTTTSREKKNREEGRGVATAPKSPTRLLFAILVVVVVVTGIPVSEPAVSLHQSTTTSPLPSGGDAPSHAAFPIVSTRVRVSAEAMSHV